jgi:hypothetical protein
MSVLPAIDPATAHPDAAAVLAKAKAEFGGTVPQLTRVMANSPATLDGYLEFYKALSGGLLGPDSAADGRGERLCLLLVGALLCRRARSAPAG